MKRLIPIFTLFLVACQSTGIVPMSQDSYYVGKKDSSPGIGVSLTNKVEVYKEASNFCDSNNLELFVLREVITPAAPAKLGSTELYFKCIASAGTATPLLKEPEVLIF